MFIPTPFQHTFRPFAAAELASPRSAPPSAQPQPLPGPPASTGQLSATHASDGQAHQEEPGADQLQGAGSLSGSGGGRSSKPRGAESRGCVEAEAPADARPAARAGEKQRRACLPGHSGFWNVVGQSVTRLLCVLPKCVYLTRSAGDI